MSADRIYFVADFNIESLARLVANSALPGAETRIAAFAPVMATLAAGPPGPEWTSVVWTRPESVVQQFQTALAFDEPDVAAALAETRAFAAAVAQFARGTRATFVPAWVLPPWHRGYGPLDMRPGLGIASLLARMNTTLAESVSGEPNVFVLDAARWIASVGARAWSDKQWFATKVPFSARLLECAADEIAAALAGMAGAARRLIVLDLDEVLWGGIVGEVGWEGLTLGGHDHVGEAFVEFQRALKALSRRGVQLAIVSKNDESTALEAIDRHPEMILRRDDFAGWRINWRDKAENILSLLADVGLGAESAVFIDDSAIERGRVGAAVPGLLVPEWPDDPASFRETLASMRCFDTTSVTREDRARTAMYSAERARSASAAAAASLDEWMASLGVTVSIEPLNKANLDRAAQLFNKTNQMNLATRRMTADELMRWNSGTERIVLTFRVTDRFGDSGLTGLIGIERDGATARLSDFLLSCRVMGRGVEKTLLHAAVAQARSLGAANLVAEFHPTARNRPCLEFFRSCGFTPVSDHTFVWNVKEPFEKPPYVTVVGAAAGSV